MLDDYIALLGRAHVLTGADTAPWAADWTGKYAGAPAAVLRPGSTAEVSALLAHANARGQAIVPVSGNTGLNGGAHAPDGLMLSLDRLNAIGPVSEGGRTVEAGAGVILSDLHDAAAAHDLVFPVTFGARGSARVGGILSTNAGGSNVLRYGGLRGLCLGLEAVLADGRVLNLMTALHKDNTGYALKDLLIGAEGTLGIITRAVLRLVPQPRAYATAMVAAPSLDAALTLLNRLQEATGGAVEAFEYMPGAYMDRLMAKRPGTREPFDRRHDVNILCEVGATAPRDATPGADGTVPVTERLEDTLATLHEAGLVLDATLARSGKERAEMWERRECAAEITFDGSPIVDADIALPLDRVSAFFDAIRPRVAALDPDATDLSVAHLGDGNIHYTVFPGRDDAALAAAIRQAIDDTAVDLGGSFSAEHGIGRSKLASMARLKDPVALEVMRSLKAALDPNGILNPGKTLPPAG